MRTSWSWDPAARGRRAASPPGGPPPGCCRAVRARSRSLPSEPASATASTTSASLGYGGQPAPEVDQYAQAQRVRAQEQLDDAADEAPPGVNPRTVLLRGDPAAEIARASDGIVDLLF